MRRSSRIRQQSSQCIEESLISTPLQGLTKTEENARVQPRQRSTRKRPNPAPSSDASDVDAIEDSEADAHAPRSKKRKTTRSGKKGHSNAQLYARLFDGATSGQAVPGSCRLPGRAHGMSYHRPLLLDSRQHRASLLTWFDSVSTS